MVFSSITFLYYFLPIIICLYCIAPKKLKNLVLLIASLTFYAWGEIRFIFIMLLLSVVDYFCGRKIDKHFGNKPKMKLYLFIDIGMNLAILFFFKYSDFVISNLNKLPGVNLPLLNIPLPLGVSFNTFQSMSYIIDVYRGTTTCEKSYYNYLTYTTLFPQIIAGPIVRYVTVEDELEDRNMKLDDFSAGLKRFLIGLGKKVLIANNVGILWDQVSGGQISEMSVLLYWIGIIAFAFQIYYDFSGYSDMAIGLARMFGMYFDENFDYPYISKSITEFWRRWHMTLSLWFRDYVYIPLGGNRKGKLKQVRNLLIVWGLTGLWHGASWNFVIWGLYFAVILILEKFVLLKYLQKIPDVFQHIYTLVLVLVSWVIFEFEDTNAILQYIKGMFWLSHVELVNSTALYYLLSYAIIFIIAAVFSTPVLNVLRKKLIYRTKYAEAAVSLVYVLILLASTAYLVSSTYNPFLYFRF